MGETLSFWQLVDLAIASQAPICLDTSAIIEYGNGGAIASLVDPVMENDQIPLVYSMISIAEVLVRPAQVCDVSGMTAIVDALTSRRNTEVVSFDQQQAVEAAWVRAETRLKLPDCAVIAAARTTESVGIAGLDRAWSSRPLGVPFFYLPDVLESGADDLSGTAPAQDEGQ